MKLKPEQQSVIDFIQAKQNLHAKLLADLDNDMRQKLNEYAIDLGVDLNDGSWDFQKDSFVKKEEPDGGHSN